MRQLTLLSGTNASGKSSILQALAMLHQTVLDHEWSTRLLINGSEVRLGTFADVADKVTGRHSFGIGLVSDEGEVKWTFSGERNEMSAAVAGVTIDGEEYGGAEMLHWLLPASRAEDLRPLAQALLRLTYLTAERVGPREVYRLEDPSRTKGPGPRGESAVSVLHSGRDAQVLDGLALPEAPPTRLRQVEARMRHFFPGCGIDIQQTPGANWVILGLRTSEATGYHGPVHVGFGLTQVLPIIVATLAAEQHDLLLIENPEVHLHPAAQSMMGGFLGRVAAAGVQVIVETHSDHVLSGLRRVVKSGAISADAVAIHYFQDRDTASDQVTSPTIDSAGNIDNWPPGFFDQFEKDMNHFAGWSE